MVQATTVERARAVRVQWSVAAKAGPGWQSGPAGTAVSWPSGAYSGRRWSRSDGQTAPGRYRRNPPPASATRNAKALPQRVESVVQQKSASGPATPASARRQVTADAGEIGIHQHIVRQRDADDEQGLAPPQSARAKCRYQTGHRCRRCDAVQISRCCAARRSRVDRRDRCPCPQAPGPAPSTVGTFILRNSSPSVCARVATIRPSQRGQRHVEVIALLGRVVVLTL